MGEVARSSVPAEFVESEAQMTPRQKEYLLDLINTRVMTVPARREAIAKVVAGLSKKDASRWIEKALTLPKANSDFAKLEKSMPHVPDGRYAVMMIEAGPDGGDDFEIMKFFKVKVPTEGRWAGFTFLDAGRGGAHGDLQWSKVTHLEYKLKVLTKIAENPEGAGKRFGQEVGVCCRCGRSLTDETSRAMGIGPDCAGKAW